MPFNDQAAAVMAWVLLSRAGAGTDMPLCGLNLLTLTLINAGIPFDTSYSPGTEKMAASAELTIHISPTAKLLLDVSPNS